MRQFYMAACRLRREWAAAGGQGLTTRPWRSPTPAVWRPLSDGSLPRFPAPGKTPFQFWTWLFPQQPEGMVIHRCCG